MRRIRFSFPSSTPGFPAVEDAKARRLALAQLFAAAPDLADALEAMLLEYVGDWEDGGSIKKARAALAKARMFEVK